LDIGTGTGLLSLILSQQLNIQVDAVEIEEPAFLQAGENFAQSQWSANIRAIHGDITAFHPAGKYGLIITNPPFFENDLKAQGRAKNLARHEASITLEQIFSMGTEWMLPGAYLAILLPAFRSRQAIEKGLANGLFLCYETTVRQTTRHDPFRVMLLFSNQACHAIRTEMAIKNDAGYTQEFKVLLAPYYLNM
jgi:tRNA1Val (adenine37-N6)-methyltransferase